MSTIDELKLRLIVQQFAIEGELLSVEPHGGGHINDTYLARFQTPAGERCTLHQRINTHVFRNPEWVMENILRVTRYAREQIVLMGGDPERETLNLIPARDGKPYVCSADGEYWRTYVFIKGAHTFEVSNDARLVKNAAKAFGNFQKLLDTLPGGRLHETIPNFHHTRKRFEAFEAAVKEDRALRVASVRPEIDFYLQREADASVVVDLLASGAIPERLTHNDTKLDNVLIDDRTSEGICVIDLDTVMPGSVLYDFGDMVRMGAATAPEDEADLSKVGLALDRFESLAEGYLEAVRDFLTPTEMDHLAFAGKLITYEQGIRFLSDYLNGDVYYKTRHAAHNLDRARNQMKMVSEMENRMDTMVSIISRHRTAPVFA